MTAVTGTGKTRPWVLRRNNARATRRERERQEVEEAIRLGVAVVPRLRYDRCWKHQEDAVIVRHASDIGAICAALPHRSRHACIHRRKSLGLMPELAEWRVAEEKILRDNYLKVSHAGQLCPLLPGRTHHAIYNRLSRMGLRIPPPAADTGSPLINAIKDRCRVLGYTMQDLDHIAKTGRYFKQRGWLCGTGVAKLSGSITKAVNALGGSLRVDWPDDGESIDTIAMEGIAPGLRRHDV